MPSWRPWTRASTSTAWPDVLLLDVNVVLAGHRDDHPRFAVVRPWLDRLWTDQEPFSVPLFVWWSFLRIATKHGIFDPPTSRSDAFDFVTAVRAQPGHVDTDPGPRHMVLLRGVADGADVTGDLFPDAVLGAVARAHSATVVTLDRDFARLEVPHLRPE